MNNATQNDNLLPQYVITPERAKGWLERNTNNFRPIMPAKVLLYADDISKGKWH